ncbi:MAG: IPTL-CTERM sorting domain-containing protein [Acidovorax sp.]|uniref:IPTL-CTERM sorting domain-containing protein n=1 Tax=Acidovorax sp. TaxID=1872122 RepID=UPI00261A75B5|nr:IPTL-CTERM sorting domain-containing protein [Acidovorax sp.]MDH4463275.1 IPTL-CTERM sorting domain-containing protein [Acidovorax sp.]
MFRFKIKTAGKVFLSFIMLFVSQLALAASSTVSLPGALAARTFVDITPSGGFSPGDTLTSITLQITSFTGIPTTAGDLAVVVAPATPNGTNSIWYSANGGLALSGASGSWSSGSPPQIGTNTLTLSTPLVLTNQRLYVGNAYSLPGNWSGSLTFNYSTAVASQPVPVPTLSEWGVIVMGALMAVFAFTRMRKKG